MGNPYRVLGEYVGSPLSVEVSHLSRIRAYAKVGQAATFELRGDDRLSPIERTEQTAEQAAQTMSLPHDRVRHALLWFSDGEEEWGQALNGAVQALIDSDYTTAITNYERLVSDNSLREEFLDKATHGLLSMTRIDLAKLIAELVCAYDDRLDKYWMSRVRNRHYQPSGQD